MWINVVYKKKKNMEYLERLFTDKIFEQTKRLRGKEENRK